VFRRLGRALYFDMTTNRLATLIASPAANHSAITERVIERPGLLLEVLAGLRADRARIRFGCLKVLRLLSERRPSMLYPHFDQFVSLLGDDNSILKWGAIIIIGNLAVVDQDNKMDVLLDRYLQPILGPVMITAANTINGAAKVALAKPHLMDKVVCALLQVETATYQTPECRNVALGHALKSLALVFNHVRDRQPIIEFARRQLRNRRNAVQRRARAFLKEPRHFGGAIQSAGQSLDCESGGCL
jgi:hypothetical protein